MDFSNKARTRAFTLVEIMMVTAIVSFVVAGTILFVRQVIAVNAYDSGRVLVNNDMLKLGTDLATDGVNSNYFIIYPNFSTRSITSGSTSIDDAMPNGSSGDMVCFIQATTSSSTGITTPTYIIGYYRDSSQSTVAGPVRRFAFPVTAALFPSVANLSDTPIYVLLNSTNGAPIGSDANNPVVIPLALGDNSGTLFYNFWANTVMLKSQIQENSLSATGTMFMNQTAQSTYNFSVTPRG